MYLDSGFLTASQTVSGDASMTPRPMKLKQQYTSGHMVAHFSCFMFHKHRAVLKIRFFETKVQKCFPSFQSTGLKQITINGAGGIIVQLPGIKRF